MVAVGLTTASSKGKGAMMSIFLLITGFVLGVIGAEVNFTEPATSVDFDWDPNNPPLWTIRPEDREEFLATGNVTRIKNRNSDLNKCENHDDPAALYTQYWEKDCPAPNKFVPDGFGIDGTCQGWSRGGNWEDACNSFCQVRTYFEWAQERPYPHSECHHPIKCTLSETDSSSCGWSIGGTAKYGKMMKMGISGGWSSTWGTSTGRTWSVTLEKGQCGYFTFVPVKKVVCGTWSESDAERVVVTYTCNRKKGPRNFGNHCSSQLWLIKNTGNARNPDEMIPDGTLLFVYTDCATRRPLPMELQDPVYRSPGVALDHDTISAMQESWVWDTCYFWDMNVAGERALYIRGSGFRDDKIGSNGELLLEKVKACAGGNLKNHKFTWYDNGKPEDSAKVRGATWLFEGDVPDTIRPGCVGEAVMEVGGVTQDQCFGDKFEK